MRACTRTLHYLRDRREISGLERFISVHTVQPAVTTEIASSYVMRNENALLATQTNDETLFILRHKLNPDLDGGFKTVCSTEIDAVRSNECQHSIFERAREQKSAKVINEERKETSCLICRNKNLPYL
jgi:hypothetical protein